MKQLIQNLKNGEIQLVDLPVPQPKPGHLTIRNQFSVVSLGTEKMLMNFGKANLINKARQQPEKVKQVLDKISSDGIIPTIKAVNNKLNTPLPMGYSSMGVVLEVGAGVEEFKPGDRVISNGPHAEVVSVGKNLACKVPDNVDDHHAAYTVVSSIALQGVRLSTPTLGETIVVVGLGLIGLITVQILRAHGCKVIAFDFDKKKVDLAKKFGASAFVVNENTDQSNTVHSLTDWNGADAVIITASTSSDQVIADAAKMSRKRGRIVLVGVVGLNINRSDFYEKELTFQVSCSYGPGRYDYGYESKGLDYPIGYVRWTEKRNFEAVLELISEEKLKFGEITSEIINFHEAAKSYENIGTDTLGVVLKYPEPGKIALSKKMALSLGNQKLTPQTPTIGVIGAGNYAGATFLPLLSEAGVRLKTLSSSTGLNSWKLGENFKFESICTDVDSILDDKEVDTIFVLTPHNTHAQLVLRGLRAGKNVFVEKPLAISEIEFEEIKKVLQEETFPGKLMVGFNRRFSPLVTEIKSLLTTPTPNLAMVYTVNAGHIPGNHWIHDPEVGGGRLVGEGCHFIDLLRHIADSPIEKYSCHFANSEFQDTFTINLTFESGAIGTIHYFSNGPKSFPKERLEIFSEGKVLELDNFKTLRGHGFNNFKKKSLYQQDKGHKKEIDAFINSIAQSDSTLPIPLDQMLEVTKVSLELAGLRND